MCPKEVRLFVIGRRILKDALTEAVDIVGSVIEEILLISKYAHVCGEPSSSDDLTHHGAVNVSEAVPASLELEGKLGVVNA